METLLDKGRRATIPPKATASYEELELVIGYCYGQVSLSAFAQVLGIPSGSAAAKIASFLRSGTSNGRITIKLNK